MKKVLIISYFFPPCKFTAASRIASWVDYLPSHNIKPFVITRNWDNEAKSYKELAENSGIKDEIVKNENSQIHYLNFKGTLRDSLYSAYGENRFSFIRRFLSLIELFFQNFFLYHPIYRKMYKEAVTLIQKENISSIIISANPFIQFQIGYKLKKKFPHIKWIADYRDDWTTTELISNRSFLQSFLHKIEIRSEKKWLSNSETFTSISKHYIEKIGGLINKNGSIILNGINNDVIPSQDIKFNPTEYIITYNGTLYETQPIEPFLEALQEIILKYKQKLSIKMNFIGLALNHKQAKRVMNKSFSFSENILITDRVSKKEVLDYQKNSNLLLMMAHKNLKGISSSKLYEYIGLHKKVLLFPNDNDILQETLEDVGLGLITNSKNEIVNTLTLEIDSFIRNPGKKVEVDSNKIEKYSRKHQVKKLANILNSLQ